MRRFLIVLSVIIPLVSCASNTPGAVQQETTPAEAAATTAIPEAVPTSTITPTIGPTSTPAPDMSSNATATPYKFSTQTKPVWETREMKDEELVPVSMEPCADETKLYSENSAQPTFLRFSNETAHVVKLHWINFAGKRDPSPDQQTTLQPGETVDIWTFVTHPFLVLDEAEKCINLVQPAPQPGHVVIEEP